MSAPRLTRRQTLSALAGGLVLAACGDGGGPAPGDGEPVAIHTTEPASRAAQASPSSVASLDEKIGELLMVGFRGFSVPEKEPMHALIKGGRLANTVLFDHDVDGGRGARNVRSPAQLAALCAELQALAPGKMLIAADQEGGLVARLKPAYGFPPALSHEDLGSRRDPAFTREYAAEMAKTLATAGINLNLAPVVDVNLNPDNPVIGSLGRSFSADPQAVAAQALAFVEGHHQHGVLTTLKHFPGHGSSRADSHLGFVDVTGSWSRDELIPYRRVIEAGQADAIMTAHVFNAKLDPTYPATLSRSILTGILRQDLGFDGVIITDDMQMAAIGDFYGFAAAIELALNAGADIIAIANNLAYDPEIGVRAFNAIKSGVEAGRISRPRIDQSYERVARLKQRLA